MFDIGFSEMILLGVIALIAIGPKQLPEVARTLARLYNEVKRATSEFTGQFSDMHQSTSRLLAETREQLHRQFEEPLGGQQPEPLGGQQPESSAAQAQSESTHEHHSDAQASVAGEQPQTTFIESRTGDVTPAAASAGANSSAPGEDQNDSETAGRVGGTRKGNGTDAV